MRDLHARGYAVWMMDWRGQGGSDRYLTAHPHKAHHNAYEEHIETLHQFITHHVVPGKPADLPLHMIAHPWAAIWRQPSLITIKAMIRVIKGQSCRRALLTAPMLDISTGVVPKTAGAADG